MLRRGLAVVGLLLVSLCVNAQGVYYPDALWQRKTPAEAGINAALLKGAIDFAVASESRNPRDLTLNHYQTFGREPIGRAPSRANGLRGRATRRAASTSTTTCASTSSRSPRSTSGAGRCRRC